MILIIYHFLCLFLLYSFFGWGLEVVFCSVHTGKFVNRGFLNGPLCPIYGFGAIMVATFLQPFNDRLVLLFIFSVLITSLLELTGGYALNKLFHIKWWDYSNQRFNLGGYVCLKFSLMWGVGCLFLVKLIHPAAETFVNRLPFGFVVFLLCIFYLLLLCDLIVTVSVILKMNRNLGEIAKLVAELKIGSDKLAENLGNTALLVADKIDELDEKTEKLRVELEEQREKQKEKWESIKEDFSKEKMRVAYLQMIEKLFDNNASIRNRLLRAFPHMRDKRNPHVMEQLRAYYAKKREKKQVPEGEDTSSSLTE